MPLSSKKTEIERFESKINKTDGCWQWTGGLNNNGGGLRYGIFQVFRGRQWKSVYAHRYSWESYFGPIPKGLFVCHHCDNPSCVNIHHLFLGTALDNAKDASSKGRSYLQRNPDKGPKGEKNGQAKLSKENVRDIRDFRERFKFTIGHLSGMFQVSTSQIKRILAGKAWV